MTSQPPDNVDPNTGEKLETPRPLFSSGFLQKQRKGELDLELADAIRDLNEAVLATGKAGTLTLKIKIGVFDRDGMDPMVEAEDTVKVVLPEGEKGKTLFFVDDEGNPSRKPNNQISLTNEEYLR